MTKGRLRGIVDGWSLLGNNERAELPGNGGNLGNLPALVPTGAGNLPKADFSGIRVVAHSLARSPEPGSITDVAASIEHVAGDQP